MALKKTTIGRIAALIKIKEADLEAALSDEKEIELTIDEKLQTFSEGEITTRDRSKYNDGKTAGEEMLIKEIKRKHAIDLDSNEPDKLVEAITKKALKDAGIAPDEQVKEKDKTIEQLRGKLKEKETEVTTFQTAAQQAKKDSALLAMLPQNRDDRFTNEQYLTLIKSEFDIVEHEGKPAVKNLRTGEIVKNDKDLQPIAPADVIKSHFDKVKWIKEQQQQQQGGRGGGNSAPGGGAISKLSELRKQAESEGISITGEKFQAMVATAKKDNPEMILD